MPDRATVPLVERAGMPLPPDDPSVSSLDSINMLIDAYEIDIHCSRCSTRVQRSISWLHKRYMMNCPTCRSVIVLRTSTMTEEIRRVSRQLKELQLQLLETVGRANSILGK